MTRHGRRPCIGILREVKNQWERRAPLIPKDVAALVASGIDVLVQPSERRVFKDVEYREAGAVITNDLTAANTIFGVKEVPADNLIPGRNYVIFSHVIKAQPDNMPFLDACLAKNVRLFDYECIRDPATSTRLVAFGRFAGNAGMIDILRGCGHRFLTMGMSTPFLAMPSAYMHASLDQAKENVVAAGREVARVGLPKALTPLTFAFTGAGNVTQGAMDIFKLLPHEYVDVDDLAHLRARGNADPHKVYGVHLKTSDLVAPVEPGATFDREHYYENPHLYRPMFHERVLPNITVLVNGIYWDHRFPRLLTAEQLKDSPTRNLAAIADISCDIGGSIQFLEKATTIDDPFVVYNPSSGTTTTDLNDDGVLLLAVDNLPAELPREASGHFSSALVDFASVLSTCAADQPFDECALPDELRAACITSNGALCHEYDYISELRRSMESSRPPKPHASAVLSITGHLFDTGLINRVLDVIELCGGGLTIHQMAVDSNRPRMSRKSNAVVEISGHDSEHIAAMSARVTQLAESLPSAEAVVTALPSNGRAASSRAPAMPASIPAVKKRVVLLGSGLVAGPCVDVLTSYDDIELVIGSDNLQQAEALARRSKRSRVAAVQIDADDFERDIRKLVQGGAAVISLLPAHLHAKVARLCIDVRTDMITASYVSPELAKLHTAAQEAGIVVLNECGLDPGLDHMSAMKMIDEIKGTGGSVVSFESTCGGLPAPEAADNPFMYKFSWSPRGALLAALNAAVYRQNGEVIAVEGKDLLRASRPLHLSPALRLEHTPNRNSLIYESEYGVEESVQSFYRGTIRYAGYSSLLYCMAQLGLLSSEARADLDGTWPALLSRLTASADLASFLESRGVSADDAGRCVSALRWLGMLDSGARVDARDGTVLDAFVAVLRPRLSFGPNERDLVILQHRLSVAPHGGTTSPVTKVSTLVQYGNPFGDSAMAQTVGVTAALAARLVLDGGVAKRGVVKPTTPDVYNPVLDMAADRGIRFVETTTAARHNL